MVIAYIESLRIFTRLFHQEKGNIFILYRMLSTGDGDNLVKTRSVPHQTTGSEVEKVQVCVC